jgi:hypothetical protein
MSPSSTLRTILGKPFMPPVFFFSGVTYDTLTLTRIDRLQDNLLLLIYLLLLGVLIVLTGRLGSEPAPEREQLATFSPFVRWVLRTRPFYPMAVQFLLGGLFSAYAIFYSRSATPARQYFLLCWSRCWSVTNFCVIGSPACVSS